MRRFLLALLCLFPLATQAAGPNGVLETGQVLRGRFVQQRHLKGFSAPLRSEGRFVLAPGKGLIWRAETPFAVTTVITAAGLVQNVGETETIRLPSARLPFLARLYDMLGGALAGDWRALAGDFEVTRSGDDEAWRVVLSPRRRDDAGIPFRSIIAKGARYVETVDIAKADGDSEDLAFLDQALSAGPLSADEARALGTLAK